jgi:hypothetical protein
MTIKENIEAWCDKTIVNLKQEYQDQGRRASGEWERALKSNIIETKTGYSVIIEGKDYTYWMENGRRPSVKFPPIQAIKKWIKDKGIIAQGITENSLAFLIARKIAREGYKGKPVVANVVTKKWIDELLNSINVAYISQLKSDILKELQNGSE